MKKLFAFVFCAMLTLCSGVLLTACDNSKFFISFVFDEPDFVTAEVVVDGKDVEANSSGKFEAHEKSQVRVWFYAKQYGVDMSGIAVKANGEDRKVFTYNTNFNSLEAGGSLCYGYILFAGMQKDVTISVSGAKSYKNKFTFEDVDLEDETTANRLKKASVKFPGQEEFSSLYDFLSGEDKSFEIDIIGQDESARAFQVKFEGGNPYEIRQDSPFKIQYNEDGEDVTKNFEQQIYENGIYTFKIGEIANNIEAKILTDFKSLVLQDFPLNLPNNNQTFEIRLETLQSKEEQAEPTLEHSFNFEKSAKIIVKKVLEDVNMTNVKAYINDFELQKDETAEDEEGETTFLIPAGMTPESTGGEDSYDFRLKGIDYGDKKFFSLQAETTENHPIKLIHPDFSSVSDESVLPVSGYDDEGKAIVFENLTASLDWEYPAVDERYITPFDLYDYDLFEKDVKILNVSEILKSQQEKPGQDFEVTLENDWVFKAEYNSSTQKYDKFHLQFVPTEDMQFTFQNFKLLEKKVNISFDFPDDEERVSDVAFAIGGTEAALTDLDWTDLEKGKSVLETMTFGEVLYFRLKAETDLSLLGDGREFILQQTIANDNRYLDSAVLRDEDADYLVLKFPLSDFFFETVEEMKLVLARTQDL